MGDVRFVVKADTRKLLGRPGVVVEKKKKVSRVKRTFTLAFEG